MFLSHAPKMLLLDSRITKAAKLDLPVLIVGETGTGKELVAHEIHARSARARHPFVALNTGALPTDLVSSELFGHVRGAFTGATEEKPGRFTEAGKGTLFLDEIGTMDDRAQVSLLRVIENNTIRAVGSRKDVEANARVIAATNQDLPELVAKGRFREDLMYRLDVIRIEVPPLREIRAEIPMLADHFIRQFAQEYELEISGLVPETLDLLVNFPWPGNIRELRNVIVQGCISAECGAIGPQHLPRRFSGSSGNGHTHMPERRDNIYPVAFRPSKPESLQTDCSQGVFFHVGLTLREVERGFVRRTLEYCHNNKMQAARMLGVSRKLLYDRLAPATAPDFSAVPEEMESTSRPSEEFYIELSSNPLPQSAIQEPPDGDFASTSECPPHSRRGPTSRLPRLPSGRCSTSRPIGNWKGGSHETER
jgi:DNA-binding NtrC family response regulator